MQATFLEELIIKGDIDTIKSYLPNHPLEITKITSHGVSPITLSCYFHQSAITTLLVEFIDNLTLFEAAAAGKFDAVAHEIFKNPEKINDYSEDGFTALGLAAYFGREEVARYLVLKGAEVNLSSNNGFNVFPLNSAAAGNYTSIARMLIENDAEVNALQKSGVSPLHSAAQNGNIKIIIMLLEKGAKIETRIEGGQLAADLAKEKGYLEIAEILS